MPPITPRFQPWYTGDLVSASKLNELMDWVDTATGLHERRNAPFYSGANVLGCEGLYQRPYYGYLGGCQVEYWIAHDGDQLTVQLSGTDPAYLYWRWDGVTLNNADAVIAPGAAQTFNIANWNNGTGLVGLYQFQPVRVMLRSTYHPNNSIFVDYLYQTNSNAGPSVAVLPSFTNGTPSSANDLNLIQAETEYALDCLNLPIPCQYANSEWFGTQQYYVGYVRHQHNRFYVDVTLNIRSQDRFFVRYNGNDVTGHDGSFDGILEGPTPNGLTVGNWYRVELVLNKYNNIDDGQTVNLWSCGEIVGDSLTTISPMDRWTHGDTMNGSAGGPPRLAHMTEALTEIGANLHWTNMPCRVAGSGLLDNCQGGQTFDGMSGYRVHRWLAYNTFRKHDGEWATATLQWFTGGRNRQSVSLPTMEAPGFYDFESSPIKPGMWFYVTGVGFAIQTPAPGANYA